MGNYTLTHTGWFFFCPVYIGDIDSECPLLEPRHWILTPLLVLIGFLFETVQILVGLLTRGGELYFPIVITGELDTPIELKD
jgi:hypothetical protein